MTQSFDLTQLPEKGGLTSLPDVDEDRVVAETPVQVKSDLDLLREELTAEVAGEATTIPVPTRPGYAVRYRCDVDGNELDTWRKHAKSKRHTEGYDGVKLDALVVANKAIAIVRNGEDLVDGYGEALHFRHRDFWELLGGKAAGIQSAADAARKFYGLDGALDAAARKVLDMSGWGDEVTPDPTEVG